MSNKDDLLIAILQRMAKALEDQVAFLRESKADSERMLQQQQEMLDTVRQHMALHERGDRDASLS